jgi:hypothetical protein
MKKLIVSIAAFFVITTVYSQATIYGKISSGKVTPCATIFGKKAFNESGNIGFTYFGLIQENWAEAQFGLYYNPTSWSQLGLSAGIEQNSKLLRTGGFIWLGKNNTSFVALLEKGAGEDNYWYKITINQKVGNFDLGLRGWRYTGFGPIFQYKIGKTGLKVWTMAAFGLFESTNNSMVVGLDLKI